jgi:hypothetical protein
MKRLRDVGTLIGEFTRYLLASPTDERGRRLFFSEALLAEIAQARVRQRARPFMLYFTLLSALDERNFAIAFQVLNEFATEVPWEQMSEPLLRRIFEVAIVADELTVAQRALNELSIKTLVKASEGKALQCLVDWRAGLIADESTIDLKRQYFIVHPEYDEYFKGRIAASTGLPSQAREHLQRCLQLAPADALALREDAVRLIREQAELPGDRTLASCG